MNWFPILLVTHIILAVALLLPTVLLPFVLRRGDGRPGTVTRILMAMQGTGTLIIAAGLAITGVGNALDPRPGAARPALAAGRARALRDQPGGRRVHWRGRTCGG